MNKLIIFLLYILIISINSQTNKQPQNNNNNNQKQEKINPPPKQQQNQNNNQKQEKINPQPKQQQNQNNNQKQEKINPPPKQQQNQNNNQKQEKINPPPKQQQQQPNLTNIINNKTNQTNLNATDGKPPEKEFNLTESLIKFFNDMFGSNNTKNDTDKEKEKEKRLEEEKKLEEQRRQDKIRRERMEKIRLDAEKAQREKEKQRQLQLEKEREEFEKQIENITISEFTNLYLEGKSGELLYHNLTQPGNLKIIFLLTDTQRTIHLTFNGPNGRGGSTLIKSFRSKNFLYYVYNAQYPGQYTFYLNNYHNSEQTEVIFAISDDSKTDERLGKKNIDKISGYLNDIDSKINQMKSKQNIINKKTMAHNESVNKHNREILLYSIAEVITMLLVFVFQTCYIKSIVEKV